MRELTKSIGSFSWALSLYGLQQMVNLLSPQDPKTHNAFDAVTRTASDQLGGALKPVFATGDRWQRGMVDLMFGFVTLDPGRFARATSDVVERSAELVGQVMPGGDCGCGDGQDKSPGGWGPMPPVGR